MLARALVFVVAVLNVLPVVVAFAPRWSRPLYGLALDGSTLEVVMRHRAVLLGCVGVGLGLAAVRDAWWQPALALAVVSKVSFLVFCIPNWSSLGALRNVALADGAALVVLALAVWLRS